MYNSVNNTQKDYDEPCGLVYDAKIKDIYKANHKNEWREESEWMSLSDI